MLDNLKFAQYVNEERKKLIKSTRERGVYVADNAQLSEVVARNSEIQPYEATSTDKISVTFLDADGTLLKREYLDIGGTATAPSNPTIDSNYLTFSGWSDTELTNITESKTIYATYTTKDNATYIFIHIPTANKAITLRFGGTITSIDWGDGTTNTTLSHTYSAIGDYVIKIVGGTSINNYILNGSSDNACVLKCYLSNTITSLSSNAFGSCYSLTSIYLPNRTTNMYNYIFSNCYSLKSIILPSSITSTGSSLFSSCYSLTSIALPRNITSISERLFYLCPTFSSITLPSSITSIDSNAFSGCYNLQQVVINADRVITIQSSTFSSDAYNTKFYVPDNLVEDYKVATNWVKFAERIYPLSSLGV